MDDDGAGPARSSIQSEVARPRRGSRAGRTQAEHVAQPPDPRTPISAYEQRRRTADRAPGARGVRRPASANHPPSQSGTTRTHAVRPTLVAADAGWCASTRTTVTGRRGRRNETTVLDVVDGASPGQPLARLPLGDPGQLEPARRCCGRRPRRSGRPPPARCAGRRRESASKKLIGPWSHQQSMLLGEDGERGGGIGGDLDLRRHGRGIASWAGALLDVTLERRQLLVPVGLDLVEPSPGGGHGLGAQPEHPRACVLLRSFIGDHASLEQHSEVPAHRAAPTCRARPPARRPGAGRCRAPRPPADEWAQPAPSSTPIARRCEDFLMADSRVSSLGTTIVKRCCSPSLLRAALRRRPYDEDGARRVVLDPLRRAADQDGVADPPAAGGHHDQPGVELRRRP